MREIHALCVKFSRITARREESFCGFAWISAKIALGIGGAKGI
jgi:hypothetical protein